MPAPLTLSELKAGESATVKQCPTTGNAFLRLREMGMLPGTTLKLIRRAPLGDPIEIKLRGYNLTLRKTEADHILVEPQSAQ